METQEQDVVAHPLGEQPMAEGRSAIADTFAGRVHIEWDTTAPVTPFGQLPFFIIALCCFSVPLSRTISKVTSIRLMFQDCGGAE
jgi:hypothetical protein